MKLNGIVNIIKKDAKTGEIIKTYQYNNIITDKFNYRYSSWNFIDFIYISAEQTSPNISKEHAFNILGVGTNISGIDSPSSLTDDGINPPYIQWSQRFSAPVTDRDIYSIGLTSNSSPNTNGNSVETYAYVSLSTPLTQLSTEVLDINYKVEIIHDNNSSIKSLGDYFDHKFRGNSSLDYNKDIPFGYVWPKLDPSKVSFTRGTLHDEFLFNSDVFSNASSSFPYTEYAFNNEVGDNLGRVVGSVSFDSSSTSSFLSVFNTNFKPLNESPVQGIFSHNNTASAPFFEGSSFSSNGLGKINVQESGWNQELLPEMFRIDIDSSGLVGTSTYKYKVRNVLGFLDNSYVDLAVSVPWIHQSSSEITEATQVTFSPGSLINIDYIDTKLTMFDGNVSTIYEFDLKTQDFRFWNVNNGFIDPSFTNIYRVRRINGELWVASKEGGLLKISADGLTSTLYDVSTFPDSGSMTNNCYAISEGSSNDIWALFEGGVATSSDAGTNWTVYSDTSPTTFIFSNWDNVTNIAVDPNSPNNNMGINWLSGGTARLYWWDTNTGGSPLLVTGSNSNDLNNNDSLTHIGNNNFKVSPETSIFVINKGEGALNNRTIFCQYGSNAFYFNNSNPQITRNVEFTKNNADEECVLIADTPSISLLRTTDASLSEQFNTTTYSGSDNPGGSANQITESSYLLKDSLWFRSDGNGPGLRIYSDSNDSLGGLNEKRLWKTYGWNGTNWELDNPNSKTTHSSSELLENGISISFDNNGGQFENTDYYTFGVLDGIWFDGSTEYYYRSGFYMKEVVQNNEIESGTIPTNDVTIFSEAEGSISTGIWGTWIDQSGSFASIGGDSAIRSSNNATENTNFPSNPNAFARTGFSYDSDLIYKFYPLNNPTSSHGFIVGLVPSSVTESPTPSDDSDITHGFWLKTKPSEPNEILIRENGSTVFTVPDIFLSTTTNYASEHNLSIVRFGNTVNYYVGETLVYTSLNNSTGSVNIQAHFDAGSSGSGFINFNFRKETKSTSLPLTGKFLRLGSSTNQTGFFDPNFHRIMANNLQVDLDVFIDGVKALIVLTDGSTKDVLNEGHIQLITKTGLLRFSDDDSSKTVTVNYTYLRD